MRSLQIPIKHLLDRTAAAVALVVLSPLLAVSGVAIYLEDRGPILFRHTRPGLGGEPMEVFKLRSMIANADSLLGADGTVSGDRITRVGRFLRRTSIDELPQLINIVRGEMSFIGPRPALMEHLDRYTEDQRGRTRMRPGITGLAQVSGRNTLPWSRRIELDNEYIDNYSLLLDARIVVKTFGVVLSGSGQVQDRNPVQVDDLGPTTLP